MQKQEKLPARYLAGGIHLNSSSRVAINDFAGKATGNIDAVVIAAAVTDDDFGVIWYPGYGEQPRQVLIEAVCFVQNRNDNAESRSIRQELRHNCYLDQQYSRNNDPRY